ncbi:lysM domain receptor-like kinase 3 isoform X1 [Ananas comosus]|uniref:non-specific serine/threonine protein kinase n=1 Tax=Ananas comosus TaxID=4615 RepID=A0A6P5EZ46_ANACO|nr:lysM domain receptor-like kinase 3 isoform X1 [Ananas comosus]
MIESIVSRSQFLLIASIIFAHAVLRSEAGCKKGCDLALGSYYISPNLNLSYIASLFGVTYQALLPYNPSITNGDSIISGSRVNVFFPCDCVRGDFLGRSFPYVFGPSETYNHVATVVYANLTTGAWIANSNSYPANNVPSGATINVTVNCSCGDPAVSKEYGLFETYPLREGENLSSVAAEFNFSAQQSLLQQYNPGVNFSAGNGIVFIPTKDPNGSYRPLSSSTAGVSGGAVAGIVIAGATLLALAICLYFLVYRRKKAKKASMFPSTSEEASAQLGTALASDKVSLVTPRAGSASPLVGITVDKSVEFSYEELSKATDDFSMANKIGQGGFGSVYYAELRGEKVAIKKMDMQATKEFLAELNVLTHVHHLNLVRLIGYCTEGSLFLVYEYIENGNLSQHLHGSGWDPLSWPARMQIALDAARALEYIHEHTVPVYIHRDIKSANILVDKNFRGKVADFGLTKLTEFGSTSLPTRVVGTFGYMPPEYAQYGDVSPKVDVFAFGVVLYELISAKEAIVRTDESTMETKGLVILFEEALSEPDPKEGLRKLIDPRLGEDYPIDSVLKMAQLAKACTQENPQLRPTMRSIVVALMTLSSTTEDWDMGSFYENQGLSNLMSGR